MLDLWGSDTSVVAPVFSGPVRVCVFGSRGWLPGSAPAALVASFVASLPAGSVVVSGGCRGVDALASSAAFRCGLSVVSFPAPWSVGLSAGPRRSAACLCSVGPVGFAGCAPVVCSVPASVWLPLRAGAAVPCPGPVRGVVAPVVACVVFSSLSSRSRGSAGAVVAARRAGVPCWACSPAGVWSRP